MAPLHWRILWRNAANHGVLTATAPINDQSYVVITVAEASVPEETLLFVMPVNRFIGDARRMQATNIAPFPGGVRFEVSWQPISPTEEFDYLNIWTDITVFDAGDESFWSVSDTDSARFEERRRP